jgi:hypothetical protein
MAGKDDADGVSSRIKNRINVSEQYQQSATSTII